ncbi:DNA repair protein RAD51 homolog 4 isoform X2 [Galleria mellonella]|uniref:DNA repair protein RAD51 homolog 4 isoform X2 n=1 Tax=Galleria mellonella TaxID=7137 RepID=A0A6J1WRP4_GALME|nr:DNA repair protein RAD51 homolog 4 isoform X2 [Galleria mellonella]
MQQLKSIELIYLNKNVLKSLTQNRITTIKDFLHEDPEKIALLTKLTFAQVLEIRNDIYKKFSAVLITGEKLLEKIIRNKKLCIGIKSLDEILDGGIPVGITEFCGLAESGKTQLCFQIAINCVKNSENNVLYIDTKGDFSALRIQKILDTNGFSHKDMALVLTKIKVIRIWSMEELIELLKKIKNKQCCIEKLALIIIDSLPCLMFQHLGDSNKLDDGEISSILKEPGFVEKRNRCLGKYWKHIPTTVVLLEKSQMSTVDNTSDLNVTVIKCCNIECDRYCTLKLGDFGVT